LRFLKREKRPMRARLVLMSAAVALLAACSNSETKAPAEGEAATPGAAETAAAPPTPQPGLWEQTVSGGALPQATTVRICQGPTEPGANPFNAPQPGVTCSQNEVRSAPGGAEFNSVCETQGMTVSSTGKVTGDMSSAYKVEVTTRASGANVPPQMAEMTMTIDAKRLGDCPAGAAPNSVVQ